MIALNKLATLLRASYALSILWVMLGACSQESTEEQTTTTETTQTDASLAAPAVLNQYSPKFQKILKTSEGVVRGISIGDPLTEVRRQEKAEVLEDSSSYISYTIDLGSNEMTDVLYYFHPQNRTIRNITLDVYLNNPGSVDSLMQEFSQYFTDKYGRPIIQERKAIAWQDEKKTKIVLKDVGIAQAPGLRIQIAQAN